MQSHGNEHSVGLNRATGPGRTYQSVSHQTVSSEQKHHIKDSNGQTNSVSRSEERREKQRQEARAQREMNNRVNTAPSPDKKEAMFAVVPNISVDNNMVTAVLGDYSLLAKHRNTHSLVGVDQMPPTPAPSTHTHDPDAYDSPPPSHFFPSSKNSSGGASHHSSSSRLGPHLGMNGLTKIKGPSLNPGSFSKSSSHNQFIEDMKRSHKSGPGPGHSNSKGSHVDREAYRGGHSHLIKDPEVSKIMSEMNDLKTPLSALIQTPRPDYQSSFTFPVPPPLPATAHGFRVPSDPSPKVSGKPGGERKSRKLSGSVTDDFRLSEDSDEESSPQIGTGNGYSDSSGIPSGLPNNVLDSMDMISKRPLSPLKTTDESSNSEDSSGSDSEESSSSEEEGVKHSPPPSSPTHSDTNHWNLATIFQQSNSNKNNESPKSHEVSGKGYADDLREFDQENFSHLSDHIDEPAPPILTTMPGVGRKKKWVEERTKAKPFEEFEDEGESRPTPKAQRTAGERSLMHSNCVQKRQAQSSKSTTRSVHSISDNKLSSHNKLAAQKPDLKSPKEEVGHSKATGSKRAVKQEAGTYFDHKKLKSAGYDSEGELTTSTLSPLKNVSVLLTRTSGRKHSPNPSFNEKTQKCFKIGSPILPPMEVPQQKRKVPGGASSRSADSQSRHSEALNRMAVSEDDRNSAREAAHSCKSEKRRRRNHEKVDEGDLLKKNGHCVDQSVDKVDTLTLSKSAFPKTRHSSSEVSSTYIQYENGVPKLICCIPITLIETFPGKHSSKHGGGVEERLNKEVLEMRTSDEMGKGVMRERVSSKSPPNEDETKLRAIWSIYKKRPSASESDKLKQKLKPESSSYKGKSPANQKLEDNRQSIQDIKLDVKQRIKKETDSPSNAEVRPKRCAALSPPPPKIVKKERRSSSKEKHEKSSPEEIVSHCGRRKKSQTIVTQNRKRTRSNSTLETGSRESSQETTSRKKMQSSYEERQPTSHTARDDHLTPEPSKNGGSQEHICHSTNGDGSQSTDTSSHSRVKEIPQSSQLASKNLVDNYYMDHESEEEASVEPNQGRCCEMAKAAEENNSTLGGDTSEYHSLPSSEHESRVGSGSRYEHSDDHASPNPIPTLPNPLLVVEPPMEMYQASTSGGLASDAHMFDGDSLSGLPIYRYISTFERKVPEISKDHMLYLNRAKELKHEADEKSHQRDLQTVMYLEASLYFILTGEAMECETATYPAAFKIFSDTLKLIKHVSLPVFRRDPMVNDGLLPKKNLILAVLSLWCQSLLSLKLYSMKRKDCIETTRAITEYIKLFQNCGRQQAHLSSSTPSSTSAPSTSTGAGGGTPNTLTSGGTWGGSQRTAANNSPSSLSPTPSPAGSVGSEGSQSSSGYSTEGARQQRGPGSQAPPPLGLMTPPHPQPSTLSQQPPNSQTLCVPVDYQTTVVKHFHILYSLTQAHEMWMEADEYVSHNCEIKEFFINLDRNLGPLTFNSSLRELVFYVQAALNTLKNLS